MKLVIADSGIPFLDGRFGPDVELRRIPADSMTAETVADADALMVRTRTRCDAALLAGSRVRAIATATIGTDHIDTPFCREAGITVANAPGCNAPGVAQYVWSSLLRCGFDPGKGETLAVVGHGHVGKIVAEWGRRLGAEILLVDPPLENTGDGFTYIRLSEALRRADAVTLHVPLAGCGDCPTFHMISGEELRGMRRNAILVNASRGAVVDTQAVLTAAEEERIRCVIDTWEGEPAISLPLLEKVEIGTPHIAGYSLEGKQRATRMALEAIAEALDTAIDVDGLAGPYTSPRVLTPGKIMESYDPTADYALLRRDPASFESQRDHYDYRREVAY